ncbi:MAG: ABC transporter ATP-binding protein [Eubacterium sp.]|nr:ABC transporter ATP-binding protein [Eubacterium sp.]
MKILAPYFKGYRVQGILAPLFKLLEVVFNLIVPLVVADIIDRGIAGQDKNYVIQRVMILILLAFLGMAASITAQFFAARSSVGFATKLRQACFDHIQSLSYQDLDQQGTGTLITRMTSDINQVQTGVNMGLRLLLRSPFIVLGSVILSFTINVKAAMVFAVAVPVLFVMVFGIMSVSIPLYTKVQKQLDHITGLTRENLSGVRVIRAFSREADTVKEFDEENLALRKMNEFVGRLSAILNPATFVIVNLATIIMINRGAVEVNAGVMQQGQVVALYNYMAQMIIELIKLASLLITLNKSIACAHRVADVLKIQPTMSYPEETSKEKYPAVTEAAVEFRHVSFTYQGAGAPSLSDIDFVAEKGQTIGIIGGTGSGKSTLINLISRAYDASEGEVLVDGLNVKDYSREDLNHKMGIVPQKAVLFRGTIRDNLKWGDENADDDVLWQALENAQAKEVVDSKEGKLDYQVAQYGRNFSGGQRQRLTIARALVRKPEILILDDSASALDFATDAALRKSIRGLDKGLTTFLISQRTSSIRQADQILVLDDGKMVGKGTHDQLMKKCKIYQEIYYSQFPDERPEKEGGAEE